MATKEATIRQGARVLSVIAEMDPEPTTDELQGIIANSDILEMIVRMGEERLKCVNRNNLAAVLRSEAVPASIIAERVDDNIVRLRLLTVNHDIAIEEAVKGLPYVNSNITSANFPNCHNGKTGVEEVELYLYRPVPKGENWSYKKVEKAIAKAGFIPADIPDLAVLKDYADELWEADIRYYITAFGKSSRWQDPDGNVGVAYLLLFPAYRRFFLYWLENDWRDGDWFVVRRK